MKAKPFELEKARAGHPVCTRDLRPARIVCYDMRDTLSDNNILALVENTEGDELAFAYLPNGRHFPDREAHIDLMLVAEQHKGYISLYRTLDSEGRPWAASGGTVWHDRDEAIYKDSLERGYITTIPVEWEE